MPSTKTLPPDFLVHREGDNVAVAVQDLAVGPAQGGYLTGPDADGVELLNEVPLGHKFALAEIAEGADIVEYGMRTGIARQAIQRGEYVHVHNVRSARW